MPGPYFIQVSVEGRVRTRQECIISERTGNGVHNETAHRHQGFSPATVSKRPLLSVCDRGAAQMECISLSLDEQNDSAKPGDESLQRFT